MEAIVRNILNEGNSDVDLTEVLLLFECPVHQAVKFGKPEVIRMMLEKGCNINEPNIESGATALHEAARLCDLEMVKVLLHHGADINIIDSQGAIPFDRIFNQDSMNGIEITKLLIPDKNDWTEQNQLNDGKLKLYWIFVNGTKMTLQLFLKKYTINLKVKDSQNNTPLHYLVQNKNWNVLELFQIRELEVNAINSLWETALHVAIDHEAPIHILRILLENGVDANIGGSFYPTALHRVCDKRRHTTLEQKREMVALLVAYGADVTKPNIRNHIFLHYLVRKENMKILEVLEYAKLNVDESDRLGQTALHFAAKNGNVTIIRWLLRRGADVNRADNYGRTPIYNVLSKSDKISERKECIAIILAHGARYAIIEINDEVAFRELYAFQETKRTGMISLFSPILAYLAMLAELDQPVNANILVEINEIDQLKKQFDDYREWIKEARKKMVCQNVSLFSILTDSTTKLTNYAKPNIVLEKAFDAYGTDMDLYFRCSLEHRLYLARKIKELRTTASHNLCVLMKLSDPTHIAVQTLISFLNYEDLENVCLIALTDDFTETQK